MGLRLGASIWVAGALAIGAAAPACSRGLGADVVGDAGLDDGVADVGIPPEVVELYSPCAEGTRVGDFSLWVMASGTGTGASVFNGRIWDHRAVSDFQRAVVSDGACTLMEPDPTIPCTPACAGDDACYPDGTCAPNSISHSVGAVTLTGLLSGAVSMEPLTGGSIAYSSSPGDLPYPAAAAGAAISLATAGGDYAPFTLAGRGVTPLVPRTGALAVTRDQPLTIEWGAPSLPAATRLVAYVYLGGDGSLEGGGVPGAGHVVCNFPDTGTGTIPASLLTRLIDQGVGTAPLLGVQRLTVSSTQIGHGCVDFSVVTPGSQRIVVSP